MWVRRARRTLAAAALLVVAYLVLVPTGRYLLRGAWEEAKILARRQPLILPLLAIAAGRHCG